VAEPASLAAFALAAASAVAEPASLAAFALAAASAEAEPASLAAFALAAASAAAEPESAAAFALAEALALALADPPSNAPAVAVAPLVAWEVTSACVGASGRNSTNAVEALISGRPSKFRMDCFNVITMLLC